MELNLYDRDLAAPSLDQILTGKVENLSFSTHLPGGFYICNFKIKADMFDAWQWSTRKPFYRLVITDGPKTLWEGRLEDFEWLPAEGKLAVTAYGYYANLGDIPYPTAYNAHADVVIKACLSACCVQISADQSNIEATDVTIDSAAGDDYLDIYPNELVEKLLAFSDSTHQKWYFAIWEDRVPYLKPLSMDTLDWQVGLKDFVRFRFKRSAADLWNSCYALYDAGGLARTAYINDTDSQDYYDLMRRYRIPNLGTVAALAAIYQAGGWVEEHKDIWPTLTNMVLGPYVYDGNGVRWSSSWVRAGQTLRVKDLIPASETLDGIVRDALTTFYIVETEYDVGRGQLKITPDMENKSLSALLAGKLGR